MTALRRTLVAAEMQGRDLLRRRLALAMLVSLPVAFYLATGPLGGQAQYAVPAAGVSAAWSIAGAAFFSVLASRRIEQRLMLAGYRAADLLVGRLLLLEAGGVVLALGFSVLVAVGSSPPDLGALVLGNGLTALIGVPLGLAVGALLPRELEGTLLLIGIVGVELSLPPDSAIATVLPLYGPGQILLIAAGYGGQVEPSWVVHGLAYALALLVVAVGLWSRRIRVSRHAAPG
jgi:hypothetical protein